MSFLRNIDSKHGMGTIALLPCKDLRITGFNLPIRLAVKVKSLQFYLKYLQEEGLFSIDGSFDCLSIDESVFRKIINDLTSIFKLVVE